MPEPLNESVRKRFRTQQVKDTAAELAVRRAVHALGLRYRVHARPEPDMRVKADLLFTRAKVAVFVDGCFWHGCPQHFIPPKNNADWWAAKIAANRTRDQLTRVALGDRGWRVLTIWEHEDAEHAALEIRRAARGD